MPILTTDNITAAASEKFHVIYTQLARNVTLKHRIEKILRLLTQISGHEIVVSELPKTGHFLLAVRIRHAQETRFTKFLGEIGKLGVAFKELQRNEGDGTIIYVLHRKGLK